MSTTNYNCDQCGKPCTAKTVIYNRYKTHFCGKECKADHQRGAKDRAKDERIRELEGELADALKGRSEWEGYYRSMEQNRDRWRESSEAVRETAEIVRSENNALEQRNRRLRALAWVGWTSCLLCLLWALWGHFGRHLPTTKPETGELVIGRQGESRTPHIAYVDSAGVWRDADNGERLEVTKWSRP